MRVPYYALFESAKAHIEQKTANLNGICYYIKYLEWSNPKINKSKVWLSTSVLSASHAGRTTTTY